LGESSTGNSIALGRRYLTDELDRSNSNSSSSYLNDSDMFENRKLAMVFLWSGNGRGKDRNQDTFREEGGSLRAASESESP
jgi:hypothetical protein